MLFSHKNNEILSFVKTEEDFESIMRSDMTQTKTNTV